MKIFNTLIWLSILIALLAAGAAGGGLFWQTAGSPHPFTTLHGQVVEIYGQGLYRNDTSLIAVGFRIGDAFTLLVGIPLLLWSLWLYRRHSLRGGLMLSGMLAYLLYTYSSLALGAAYNNLLLVYIVLTAATCFGFVTSLMGFDQSTFRNHFSRSIPVRGISVFLIVSGVLLFNIWLLLSIVPALLAGTVPLELASYTTIITFVIDMALIAPALIIVGLLLLRQSPLGFILAPVMLVFIDVLGLSLLAMGIGQQLAGLISVGQFIGFVVSFAILTLFSLWFTVIVFRTIFQEIPFKHDPVSPLEQSGLKTA